VQWGRARSARSADPGRADAGIEAHTPGGAAANTAAAAAATPRRPDMAAVCSRL